MSIQLAMKLYLESNLISICEDGRFIDFEIEKDHSTAATVSGQAC